MPAEEAYLDIETTGLSPDDCEITVTGIYRWAPDADDCVQLIGRENTADNILEALDGIPVIYTYNGRRFDLPFIHRCTGINLERRHRHQDLMFDCWRNSLRGGLKSVERQLGIRRELPDVNGLEAVRLWWRYVETFDLDALEKLKAYNREDVVNLKTLKEMLCPGPAAPGG